MIRLRKSQQPESLKKGALAWTKELLRLRAQNAVVPADLARKYNQPDVKAAATRDSFSKCIYCESKVLHVSFGDIEHIKPKKTYPEFAYDWDNLGLVCTKCNNSKGDQYDEAVPPVNPFVEDPSAFLVPLGALIWPQSGSDRAQETISLVDLNRAELVVQRSKRLESVRLLAETLNRTSGRSARMALAEQLRIELKRASEYSFVARAVAILLGAVTASELETSDSESAA